ncbi:MAG TPA: BON domain-containing protein [Prosthecobacter sp.]
MKPTLQMFSLLFSSLIALSAGSMGASAQEPAAEKKDAVEETKTPLDQSNRPEDLKITQAIRKAVIADDTLSLNAKNVRIITADGKVTLVGKVNSAEENAKVMAYAKESAGTAQVVNQMEVKAAQP